MAIDPSQAFMQVNIATSLDKELLTEIGKTVVEEYEADEDSRIDWLERANDWLRLALQTVEEKSYPWPNASNIKYPLISIAALQFHARAYPALINMSGGVVKGEVIGFDPDGEKTNLATRISKHMNYQLAHKMTTWEEGMDKLLLQVPIVGCAFKKIYYSPYEDVNKSELISAKDLVVDYYAKSLEEAKRITHVFELYKNDVISRQRAGIFLDVDIGDPNVELLNNRNDPGKEGQHATDTTNNDIPYIILEQHRWLDLDDDGYEEPYIVTVDYNSQQVLRITARYNANSIVTTENNAIGLIKPDHYFVKYSFIPNPDGGFYDVGFGLLLGTINEGVNTILNQLVDAGHLSNLQSGFLSRGIRMKGGNISFKPGEWKTTNATGDDLKKGIFPMPVRDPSPVLFQLLQLLVSAAKELSTVSDIMTGKMPGQNTPATTTMAAVEEGQKVFTAIYKRIYRALAKEFLMLFEINKLELSNSPKEEPFLQPGDYANSDLRVIPAADPNLSSQSAKLERAQLAMQLMSTGVVNGQIAVKMLLEAAEMPNIEQLMQVPPPQPPMELQLAQMEYQYKDKWETQKMQIELLKAKVQEFVGKTTAALNLAKVDETGANTQIAQMEQEMAVINQLFDHSQAIISGQQSQEQQIKQQQQTQKQAEQQNILRLIELRMKEENAAKDREAQILRETQRSVAGD